MSRKYIVLISLILFMISFMLSAEFAISGGSGFTAELTGVREIIPYAGLSMTLDSYKFLDQSWSIFWDGTGKMTYDFMESLLSYGAMAGGDISYMTDTNLSRVGLRSYYEGSLSSTDEYFIIEPEFYFSHDFRVSTLYTEHSLSIYILPENNLSYTGKIGFPLLFRSAFLLEPIITGGVTWDEEDRTLFMGSSMRASWYPGYIFYLDGDMGLKMYFSDTSVCELQINPSLSYSVNNKLSLQFMMPVIFQFNEKPDYDWIFLTPGLSFNYRPSDNFIISLVLTDQIEKMSGDNPNHKLIGTMEITRIY